jgi:hypothetical protein
MFAPLNCLQIPAIERLRLAFTGIPGRALYVEDFYSLLSETILKNPIKIPIPTRTKPMANNI